MCVAFSHNYFDSEAHDLFNRRFNREERGWDGQKRAVGLGNFVTSICRYRAALNAKIVAKSIKKIYRERLRKKTG